MRAKKQGGAAKPGSKKHGGAEGEAHAPKTTSAETAKAAATHTTQVMARRRDTRLAVPELIVRKREGRQAQRRRNSQPDCRLHGRLGRRLPDERVRDGGLLPGHGLRRDRGADTRDARQRKGSQPRCDRRRKGGQALDRRRRRQGQHLPRTDRRGLRRDDSR